MPAACLLGSAAVPGCLPLLAAPAAMAGPMPPNPRPPTYLHTSCPASAAGPRDVRLHLGVSIHDVVIRDLRARVEHRWAAPCRAAPPGQQQAQQPSGPVAGLVGNMLLCLRSEHLASPPSLLHTQHTPLPAWPPPLVSAPRSLVLVPHGGEECCSVEAAFTSYVDPRRCGPRLNLLVQVGGCKAHCRAACKMDSLQGSGKTDLG